MSVTRLLFAVAAFGCLVKSCVDGESWSWVEWYLFLDAVAMSAAVSELEKRK